MGTYLGFGIVTKIRMTYVDNPISAPISFPHDLLALALEKDWCLDTSLYEHDHPSDALEMNLPLNIIKSGAPEFLKITDPLMNFYNKSKDEEKFKALLGFNINLGDVSDEQYFQNFCSVFSEPSSQIRYLCLRNEPFEPLYKINFECLVLKWEGKTFMEEYGNIWRFNHFCIRKAFPNNKLVGALGTFISQ